MKREKFEELAYRRYNDSIVYMIYDLFGKVLPSKVVLGSIISFHFNKLIINIVLDDIYVTKNILQMDTINKAKNNIKVINIFKYELRNVRLYFIIKNITLRALNEHDKIIVPARKTIIKEIRNDNVKDFLNRYHLQGYTKASINIGLFYNNELVSVMTFGTPRMNRDYQYELIRLASKCDVIGGTEKMFKYFINTYNPKSILSYCDITKFSGNIYSKLGFKTSLKDITLPNYTWWNIETNSVLPRYKTMKRNLTDKGIGTEEMTEEEIMKNLGYTKMYNCGNLKFHWEKE